MAGCHGRRGPYAMKAGEKEEVFGWRREGPPATRITPWQRIRAGRLVLAAQTHEAKAARECSDGEE